MTSVIACLVVSAEAIIALIEIPTQQHIAPNPTNLYTHLTNVVASTQHAQFWVIGIERLKTWPLFLNRVQ